MAGRATAQAPTAVLRSVYKAHLTLVKEGQAALLSCMRSHEGLLPPELGEELEDVANRYLDMADMVSDRVLAARRAGLASPSRTASVATSSG